MRSRISQEIKHKILFLCLFVALFILNYNPSFALEKGALLYRTSAGGLMYGYNDFKLSPLHVRPGHVGIYIGKEKGVDMVLEANEGVVRKIPAKKFVNLSNGEIYLGAKIPKILPKNYFDNILILIRKYKLIGQKYDFDFRRQKGPNSGDWTCCKKTI